MSQLDNMKDILVLSGWTCSVEGLQRVLPFETIGLDYSEYDSENALLNALRDWQNMSHIVAWSQGAQLALKAMARGVLLPKKVTLIAPPMQFVQGDAVRCAMDGFTYQQFCKNYADDSARTKRRFHGLVAKNDANYKQVMGQLSHHHDAENTARWLPWLKHLGQKHLRDEALSNIRADIQIIHGLNDQIVPVKQASMLAELLPSPSLHLLPNCAHAPHLHDVAQFVSLIKTHHELGDNA